MKPLILVIEEFEILRAQLDEMLSDAGYRVRLAKTFPEGIAQTQQQKYEVVLLDVACCPDGLAQPFEPETPVLLTATKSHREKANRILQNRTIDCINKPFNKVEVLSKVARAIKHDQSRTLQNGDESRVMPEVLAESTDIHKNEQPEPTVRRVDIARLHFAIEEVSEARSVYLKCLQQQERNNRIVCDEHYRVLEHARANLETQLNEYIDTRIKLASLATVDPMLTDHVEDRPISESAFWARDLLSRPTSVAQGIDLEQEVSRYEMDLIRRALEVTDGHQSRAARLLRMNPTTLSSKIKKYGIVL